jgi:hypothetical protein
MTIWEQLSFTGLCVFGLIMLYGVIEIECLERHYDINIKWWLLSTWTVVALVYGIVYIWK